MIATHFIEVWNSNRNRLNTPKQTACNNISYLQTYLNITAENNYKTIAIFKIKLKTT